MTDLDALNELADSIAEWGEQGDADDIRGAIGEIKKLRERVRSWQSVAERLETEIQDLLHACDCEIRDQTNNRTASDKRSAAYAEGALRVAKGIAYRIREKAASR